jgi:hypothetical protein
MRCVVWRGGGIYCFFDGGGGLYCFLMETWDEVRCVEGEAYIVFC